MMFRRNTITDASRTAALPGCAKALPMVFAGLPRRYCVNMRLRDALDKLEAQ